MLQFKKHLKTHLFYEYYEEERLEFGGPRKGALNKYMYQLIDKVNLGPNSNNCQRRWTAELPIFANSHFIMQIPSRNTKPNTMNFLDFIHPGYICIPRWCWVADDLDNRWSIQFRSCPRRYLRYHKAFCIHYIFIRRWNIDFPKCRT